MVNSIKLKKNYDVVVVGSGHNGLVSACYLAQAGFSVCVLEKNDYLGGATTSKKIFPGVEANLSKYSYLISMLPEKIISDLSLPFRVKKRDVGSFTPWKINGKEKGLLISNVAEEITRNSFIDFLGNDQEYLNFANFYRKTHILAKTVWPTILKPLLKKSEMKNLFQTAEQKEIWEEMFENPLGRFVEKSFYNDIIRGIVFTDAKISNPTYSDDPSLLQNRTFIYHVIGNGNGAWNVPVGGMGALVNNLVVKAKNLKVDFQSNAEVKKIEKVGSHSTIYFVINEKEYSLNAKYSLINASPRIARKLLGNIPFALRQDVEGTAFKINMILKKLPGLKSGHDPKLAFSGTFHIDEGYSWMDQTHRQTQLGILPERIAGEMYCHTLTDDTILSTELRKKGFQTLTLFGIDLPYRLFTENNEETKKIVTQRLLASINQYTSEPIESCLAIDAYGNQCLEARSALDLENDLGLTFGNIFHTSLSWPFLQDDEEYKRWGVEIGYDNIFICGAGALRGGCVSGIPGHNAAMKIFEQNKIKLP